MHVLSAESKAQLLQLYPSYRWGTPESPANMVEYLN